MGTYGAVMGLAGLGLTARSAAPLFPGVFRAPAYFTETWVAFGLIALLLLIPAHLAKLVRSPAAVREDFTDPELIGFCGALPVGMTLVAGGVGAYLPALGSALWWIGCALLASFQIWAVSRWLRGGFDIAKLNAGWLILMVGGIVVPGPGIGLGHTEASHIFFGISASAAAVLVPLLFFRAGFVPTLPEALRPTWFILLVPPSLIYANGTALFPLKFLESLYFFALLLAVALFVYARGFTRWPFGPPWWAFTFPLDSLAYAATEYAQTHPEPLWKDVAGVVLLLATLMVAFVLLKTLYYAFATPRSAASPPG